MTRFAASERGRNSPCRARSLLRAKPFPQVLQGYAFTGGCGGGWACCDICCMAMFCTLPMPPGMSGYAAIVMVLDIEVGICIEACMADGEPYDRDML